MSNDIAGKSIQISTVNDTRAMAYVIDGVKFDGANVVQAEKKASTGVIQMNDAVIMPRLSKPGG